MEGIHHYFEPYKDSYYKLPNFKKGESLGDNTSFYSGDKEWFLNVKTGVVIIGVPESRNSINNSECEKSPNQIRKSLYSLKDISTMQIYDAGDIKGNTINDRYQALKDVVQYFLNEDVVIILIGGSHDLTVPIVESVASHSKSMQLVVGDALIDAGEENITSQGWLQELANKEMVSSIDVDFFGLQNFLQSDFGLSFLKKYESEVLWLGQILNENINLVEVLMRPADFVSIDYRIVANQPQWTDDIISPHGLTPNSACAMSKYAGLSDVLKIYGIFETPNKKADCLLAAQMIWHFITGVNNRNGDYPFKDIKEYQMYVVPFADVDINIKFYHNKLNNRWWIGVTIAGENQLVPCHYHDYLEALNGTIPDVWIKKNK